MKKWMLLAVAALCLPMLGQATQRDSNLYRGDLSLKTVLNMIQKNKPLPLYISDGGAFNSKEEKKEAIAQVKNRLKNNPNYWTYYNAAVVYSSCDYQPEIAYDRCLSKQDANQAIAYADKAISYYQNNPKQTVYMHLLKGNMLFMHSVTVDIYGTPSLLPAQKENAQRALNSYKTVEKVNPSLAPYDDMAHAAKVLGQKDLAKKYYNLELKREQKIEQ